MRYTLVIHNFCKGIKELFFFMDLSQGTYLSCSLAYERQPADVSLPPSLLLSPPAPFLPLSI